MIDTDSSVDKHALVPDTQDSHEPEVGPIASAQASAEDVALISRLLARDEAAFETIVDRYHGALLRLALVFVADRSAAEEVVQDTWMGVLTGLRSFEGRSSLKTWIFRILINKAKTRGVRERRSVPFSALLEPDGSDEPAVDPSYFHADGTWANAPVRWDDQTPERLLMAREARATIEKAIAALPPHQRAVITLRDIDGLDAADVCNVLAISETNQRVLLHRARSRVRRALDQCRGRG